MGRNVEVKAPIHLETVRRRAEALADEGPFLLQQHDTFYQVPNGRLKLRRLGPQQAELIWYERPDDSGPKTSHYVISPTRDGESLRQALSAALGVLGEVVKQRELFLKGRTRIHLDTVQGLGEFLELEVVLAEDEDSARGRQEAAALLAALGVAEESCLSGAYLDLLLRRAAP